MWKWKWHAARDVLGINRRNLEYVFPHNPRRLLQRVDNKLVTKLELDAAGIPVPRTIVVANERRDITACLDAVEPESAFVIKPASGSGGQGILLVRRAPDGGWQDSDGARLDRDALRFHIAAILSGMFTNDGSADRVLLEALVREAAEIASVHGSSGVSDIRVLVLRSTPVAAMLRLPTGGTHGKANLHAGGIGVGIDVASGETTLAVCRGKPITTHPSTGRALGGFRIPGWADIRAMSVRCTSVLGLDYLGIDIALDAERGPLVLEANARPGLAIQLANGAGLLPVLRRVPEHGAHG